MCPGSEMLLPSRLGWDYPENKINSGKVLIGPIRVIASSMQLRMRTSMTPLCGRNPPSTCKEGWSMLPAKRWPKTGRSIPAIYAGSLATCSLKR